MNREFNFEYAHLDISYRVHYSMIINLESKHIQNLSEVSMMDVHKTQ